MELSLAQIYNAMTVVQRFSNTAVPVNLAFKIGRILDKFLPEYNKIEKQRNILIEKYGEKKEGNFVLKEENKDVFLKEFVLLLEEKINIDFEPIDITYIPNDIKLTVQDAMAISFLIKS